MQKGFSKDFSLGEAHLREQTRMRSMILAITDRGFLSLYTQRYRVYIPVYNEATFAYMDTK